MPTDILPEMDSEAEIIEIKRTVSSYEVTLADEASGWLVQYLPTQDDQREALKLYVLSRAYGISLRRLSTVPTQTNSDRRNRAVATLVAALNKRRVVVRL